MRGKSTYIILITFLIVFCIFMIFLYGKGVFTKDKNELVLMVGDNTIWYSKDKKWFYVSSREDIDKLNWNNYYVYMDNNYFGNYYMWHDDKWYLFKEDKTAVLYEGELLAYKYQNSKKKMSVGNIKIENDVNQDFINKVLIDNNITDISEEEYSVKHKASFDFDNDNNLEDFYIISNAFSNSISSNTVFSIVFMVDDGNITYIYQNVDTIKSFSGCKPFFRSFIDVDQDKTYELVLSCGRYSTDEEIDMLYQYKNGDFKILISNQ